jgi:uncharacterized protein YrrD
MTSWELNDLKDLPVVSKNDARTLGRIEEVLFNPKANALFGLVVKPEDTAAPALLVTLSAIASIGPDAVTVESHTAAKPFMDNVQAQEISAAGGYRTGMDVMTESGESVGKIDKVSVDEKGAVVSYHSTTGLFGSKHDIEPSEVRSGSEQMLIISNDAHEGAAKTVTG